jgi:hypothetical protein
VSLLTLPLRRGSEAKGFGASEIYLRVAVKMARRPMGRRTTPMLSRALTIKRLMPVPALKQ